MTKEKNINASAEKNKSADEHLSNKELDSVAGGFGDFFNHGNENSDGKPMHCH